MDKEDSGGRTIGAVENAIQIVRTLQRLEGATLADLAAEVELTKGTIHTHLVTLQRERLVEKTNGEWRLSNHFIPLGEHVRNQNILYRTGKQEIDELAERTGETVHLIVEDDGLETIIYEAFGEQAVGEHYYLYNREKPERLLHDSAAGKAILAYLPEERVQDIAATHGLPEQTKRTITDIDELLDELSTVREREYAMNDQEAVLGIRAVGVPIFGPDDSVLGAISCSAPASRFDSEQLEGEIPRLLKEYANIIEVNIQTDQLNRF